MDKEIRKATERILRNRKTVFTYEEAKRSLQEIGVIDSDGEIVEELREYFVKIDKKDTKD